MKQNPIVSSIFKSSKAALKQNGLETWPNISSMLARDRESSSYLYFLQTHDSLNIC